MEKSIQRLLKRAHPNLPVESDGGCNGGPKAGMFWGEQAEELVKYSKL